jgi:hypothetical protein
MVHTRSADRVDRVGESLFVASHTRNLPRRALFFPEAGRLKFFIVYGNSQNYFFLKKKRPDGLASGLQFLKWLRGLDLNQRPSGYEPDELPDCSTPRMHNSGCGVVRQTKRTIPAAAKINFAMRESALRQSGASESFPDGLADFRG